MSKAIETFYNGHRFRSRLEARWAVFFDALGIRYEYEPEGWILPNGLRYLPDFYLPDLKIWIEVKGVNNNIDTEKVYNFDLANRNNDEYRDIIMVGDIPPNTDDIVDWVYRTYKNNEKFINGFMDFPYLPCVCPTCGKFGFEFDGRGARICRHDSNDKGYSANNYKIKIAYKMAREAKFEYGETPKIDSIISDMVPKAAMEWYIKNILGNDTELNFDNIVAMWEKSLSENNKEENNG